MKVLLSCFYIYGSFYISAIPYYMVISFDKMHNIMPLVKKLCSVIFDVACRSHFICSRIYCVSIRGDKQEQIQSK
jgi:hypothetical protein